MTISDNSRRNFLKMFPGLLLGASGFYTEDTFAKPRRTYVKPKRKFIVGKKPIIKAPSILRVNENYSENLESLLKNHLTTLKRKGILGPIETPGFLIYDVDNHKKVVGINEEIPFQCASMVKPLVALAFFDAVEKGNLDYTLSRQQDMALMIQKSNNESTNYFFDLLGGPMSVQNILLSHYPKLFKNLEIVENIPTGGKTYLNRASPQDYNRFLCALWRQELPYSQEIMYHMSEAKKGRNIGGTKIPSNDITVYNKTGTTAMLYGDMGLFNINTFGINKTYTQIGLFERESRCPDSQIRKWYTIRKSILRGITEIVYEHMSKQT